MSEVNESLPLELLRSIDPVCDAFERACKRGDGPVIERYLDCVAEAVRPVLRAELVRLDLEWRCRRGERPAAEEYRSRFPDCGESLASWLEEAQVSAALLTPLPAATRGPGASCTGIYRSPRPAERDGPPNRLGEYELLERLGSGGMGEVYRARHRRLDRLVALKLLPAGEQLTSERLMRFLREARAVGGLDHPNVVEAYDAGEQAGIVYLVMKLVEGADLGVLVQQRGPLPIAEVCELARQAAVGLQYLHEHGLVHRDIKPSNLMRTPDGQVKILDLGLARWREETSAGEELTEAGQPMGTPDFLAPEQARSAAEADIRADLYGLGATLFYLLTGRAPFAHRRGPYEKLEAHRAEAPPDLRSLRPEVPAALAELVGRLLAKRPEDRPRTPAEVAAALAGFAHPSSMVTLPGSAAPARPSVGRMPRRLGLALGGGVLVLLAVLALALMRRGRPGEQPSSPGGEGVREPVRVLDLAVTHFANVQRDGEQLDEPRGLLGRDSFAARCDDSVLVAARLSRPAYAYLIAFRPDGTEEVCWPEKEDEPPPLTDHPQYPPPAARGVNYGLNEGEGLQAFAVVVSSRPLPSFKEWKARRGASPWAKHPAAPGIVWCDDGTATVARTADDGTHTRGKGRTISGKSPLAGLIDWLRRDGEFEAAAAVGFAVLPKK